MTRNAAGVLVDQSPVLSYVIGFVPTTAPPGNSSGSGTGTGTGDTIVPYRGPLIRIYPSAAAPPLSIGAIAFALLMGFVMGLL